MKNNGIESGLSALLDEETEKEGYDTSHTLRGGSLLPEKQEKRQNILSEIAEIPEDSQEYIKKLHTKLRNSLLLLEELDALVDPQQNSTHDRMDKTSEINRLESRITTSVSSIMSDLGYSNYQQYLPNIWQGHNISGNKHIVHLPETLEAAMLANDEAFLHNLDTLRASLARQKVLNNYASDSDVSDLGKLQDFLRRFGTIPRNDREQIRRWLLQPIKRVASSVFVHVTSELALPRIAKTGKVQSANLVPDAGRTGAHPARGYSATLLERRAIYFDQNSISTSYGMGDQVPVGVVLKNLRRVWFVLRGDILLKQGMLQRSAFELKHPFVSAHNLRGEAFITNDQESKGTEISLDDCIIVIPRNNDDVKKMVMQSSRPTEIVECNPSLFQPGKVNHEEPDINVIRDFNVLFQAKCGRVNVPSVAISCVDMMGEDISTKLKFPVLVPLKESGARISNLNK